MSLTKTQTSLKTVLVGIVNSLPLPTMIKTKELATIDKMVDVVNAADTDAEITSRIKMFNISAMSCAQRCATPANRFADPKAKAAEFLATALGDYATLQAS